MQVKLNTYVRPWVIFWLLYISIIYGYLYVCILYGGPFFAYDHINYIDFLNSPVPFLFEPLYYLVSLLVNLFISEDNRFPLIFIFFTAPPFFVTFLATYNQPNGSKKLMIFAAILTKSFYIGFISQRIFFAELIVTSAIIYFWEKKSQLIGIILAGLIHFSALTILPILIFLRSRFSYKIVGFSFLILILLYVLLKLRLVFSFFGFDYSRYLDAEFSPINLFTLLQTAVLTVIIYLWDSQKNKRQLIFLAILLGVLKVLFSELEVFSRVFQIITDVILIFLGFSAKKTPLATYLFCLGFAFLQIFIVSRSDETREVHVGAVINAISSFN